MFTLSTALYGYTSSSMQRSNILHSTNDCALSANQSILHSCLHGSAQIHIFIIFYIDADTCIHSVDRHMSASVCNIAICTCKCHTDICIANTCGTVHSVNRASAHSTRLDTCSVRQMNMHCSKHCTSAWCCPLLLVQYGTSIDS